MATRKGVVKKTLLNEFSNPRRKGIWAINLDEGDEVIAARLVKPRQQVMLFTYNGMAVRFDESNVRPMGRMARGVKGVTLRDENDYVVGCEVVNGNETFLLFVKMDLANVPLSKISARQIAAASACVPSSPASATAMWWELFASPMTMAW